MNDCTNVIFTIFIIFIIFFLFTILSLCVFHYLYYFYYSNNNYYYQYTYYFHNNNYYHRIYNYYLLPPIREKKCINTYIFINTHIIIITIIHMKINIYLKDISQYSFILLIFLSPILFIPFNSSPLEFIIFLIFLYFISKFTASSFVILGIPHKNLIL
ncbi:hypothetical protein SLOPH_793 [Spraguea lophii 42_110]|uniref:Uncharacterized protein n=1 Tax=Spraguea lophii (strain 42_110) TaxID=1358809 RepID=S7XU68_SPRLO|nr:hypothetical protein SLOPH_793 [Spraguea lophii 42_110]